METDPLRLDNQLCFPLYAASKEIVRMYRPFLEPLGLTYTQYIAMMVLWEHRRIHVKALGERLFLDSGTLTPLLKRLEAQGWVTRERDARDERNVMISLSPEGERLKDAAADIPAKVFACVPLEAEEAKVLYGLLYKVLGR